MTDSHDDKLLKQLGDRAREVQRTEALRPLGDDFNARMEKQIKESLGGAGIEEDQPLPRSASSNRWMAVAASAIVAVGLSFVMLTREELPPLPGYELSVSGGAVLRSDDARAPLQLGDRLTATLRPQIDTDAELDVRVHRQSGDGWMRVPATVQVAPSGAARITVALDTASGVQTGRQDWWFVVGRRDALPNPDELPAGDRARDDSWIALRERFELVP